MGLPPSRGSKKLVPRLRSVKSIVRTPASTGVAKTTSTEVTMIIQTKIGIRARVMPGARIVITVTRKLIAPPTEEIPRIWTPRIQRSVPAPTWADTGGYSVQPALALPPIPGGPLTKNELNITTAARGISQRLKALIRG